MLRVFLLLALLLVGVYYARRWLARIDPARLQQWLRQFALISGGILLLLLLARSGPAAALLLPLLLPLLLKNGSLGRLSSVFSSSSPPGDGPTGQTSAVTTQFLRMLLDHCSGEMQGTVLAGHFQGRELASLSAAERLALWRECQTDPQSVAVLEAYLDRLQPDWRKPQDTDEPSEQETHRRAAGKTRMDRQEACQILDVAPNASRDEIKAAHRRLMQKLHPDHGGSSYLAARINEAKDVLLKG